MMTGSELRTWRKANGFSQRILARELGVDPALICLWENDRRAIRRSVERLLPHIPPLTTPSPAHLLAWRVKHHISRNTLAVFVGASSMSILNWENGSHKMNQVFAKKLRQHPFWEETLRGD